MKYTTEEEAVTDTLLGIKLREIRLLKGLSQEALGNKLGISFQQIQKYEKGTNRISFSRLVSIASVLEVNIDYFLKEDNHTKPEILTKGMVELFKAYEKIKNTRLKKQFVSMAKTLAEEGK